MHFVFIYSFTLLLVLKEIKGVIPCLSAKSSQVCKIQGTTSLFNITFVKIVRFGTEINKKAIWWWPFYNFIHLFKKKGFLERYVICWPTSLHSYGLKLTWSIILFIEEKTFKKYCTHYIYRVKNQNVSKELKLFPTCLSQDTSVSLSTLWTQPCENTHKIIFIVVDKICIIKGKTYFEIFKWQIVHTSSLHLYMYIR